MIQTVHATGGKADLWLTLSNSTGIENVLGSGRDDTIKGNEADDFAEGNQGSDRLEGNDGEDDLIGGSSAVAAPGVGDPDADDQLAGGAGADVLLGDNASITRATTGAGSGFDWDTVANNWLGPVARRSIALLDKSTLIAGNFGGDVLSGGAGADVAFGQDGDDRLYGGSEDDYLEGNGGSDVIFGDQGQDDLIGGSSELFSLDTYSKRPDGGDILYEPAMPNGAHSEPSTPASACACIPTGVASTGTSHASASSTASPKPSRSEGTTTALAALTHSGTRSGSTPPSVSSVAPAAADSACARSCRFSGRAASDGNST